MPFRSLVEPVNSRPKSAHYGPAATHGFIRDQLSISSWLALGALAQGLTLLLIGKWALLPVVFLLGYKATDTYLMVAGFTRNRFMDGVIQAKFSAQMPDELGNYGDKPANNEIVVILVGIKNNHPMGMLAPGFKDLGGIFDKMCSDLEEHAEEYGYLGMTSWISPTARQTSNELMNVCYFKDHASLDKFAHSVHHRDAWSWYNKMSKGLPHISIWHETFCVPKHSWEAIYVNAQPSNMASTTYKITDKETGGPKWASPVVDASKGKLRSAGGRMNMGTGKENDKYELSS